ncbi:VPLPA-CTERM sorting domain-containing protein [Sulfurirhabdus autotrophica]|uniref:Putative secreted protein n=1 Tax=Sulfurirhabdus autotrophica TaxID=1706046 RepID=A0A4R3XQU8_9PROT|nr:VPLPA-CTERM sorting domain-containing protein [Sulfurirhabdus autotrophica]TCV79025.1 putative secreted protein [Sulfurirhabdus autotrophica]
MNQLKQMTMSVAVSMLFCASAAHAVYTPIVSTTGNNMTMVGSSNGLTGGTNDVTFTWNGTWYNSLVRDGSSNATLSSPTAFSGKKWTAHNVNVYAAGNYTFYTGCPAGDPACGIGPAYNLSVGYGQVGVHLLWDWSSSKDVDIVLLWDMNKSWMQTGTTSPFSTGGTNLNGNTMNTVWSGVSIDTNMDTDNYSGTQMLDGPFVGQSMNFNVTGVQVFYQCSWPYDFGLCNPSDGPGPIPGPLPTPIPASAWLLGSGLLGLIGLARREK